MLSKLIFQIFTNVFIPDGWTRSLGGYRNYRSTDSDFSLEDEVPEEQIRMEGPSGNIRLNPPVVSVRTLRDVVSNRLLSGVRSKPGTGHKHSFQTNFVSV